MLKFDIFDRVSDRVYVTDIETNEIIYANPSILRLLGIDGIENIKGAKCYKVLQGNDRQCDFCTNSLLKENEFYEWTIYNRLTGKDFLNQDTLIEKDGRKYRLEISVEKDKQDDMEAFYEKLGNEVLGAALKEDNIEDGIRKSIGILGEKMHADRIYIFELDGNVSNNTYEWCAEGISPEIHRLQSISNGLLEPWYNMFKEAGEVVIRNLEDIKTEYPELYGLLKPQNISTLVVQPIYVKKELRGFFGVDNIDNTKVGRISAFMKMMATYVSDLIEKRDNRYNLERMSKYDALTSLYNRKIAEHMINLAVHKYGGALLIIDLDNFKAVNDLFGHQRGDILLEEVAQRMKSVCREKDIVFRLGGDEFGIFYVSMQDEESIAVKCKNLLKLLNLVVEDRNRSVEVSASIGVALAPHSGKNFGELYTKADIELYRAKDEGKNRYFISL